MKYTTELSDSKLTTKNGWVRRYVKQPILFTKISVYISAYIYY